MKGKKKVTKRSLSKGSSIKKRKSSSLLGTKRSKQANNKIFLQATRRSQRIRELFLKNKLKGGGKKDPFRWGRSGDTDDENDDDNEDNFNEEEFLETCRLYHEKRQKEEDLHEPEAQPPTKRRRLDSETVNFAHTPKKSNTKVQAHTPKTPHSENTNSPYGKHNITPIKYLSKDEHERRCESLRQKMKKMIESNSEQDDQVIFHFRNPLPSPPRTQSAHDGTLVEHPATLADYFNSKDDDELSQK